MSAAHRSSRVRSSRFTDRRLAKAAAAPGSSGMGGSTSTARVRPMSAAENWGAPVGTTRRLRPRNSAVRLGQRLPQVDDGLERRWTEDHQGISTGQHLPHSASEVGEQSTHIDHHIGVEGAEHIGDDRPGLLVGDRLMHAAQTEEHREAPGEVVDVVPDILRAGGCAERRRRARRDLRSGPRHSGERGHRRRDRPRPGGPGGPPASWQPGRWRQW